MENCLTCPICCEYFNEADRCPLTLLCGHSLCQACVARIKANSTEMLCPQDRHPDSRLFNEIPKNFALIEIMNVSHEQRGAERCALHPNKGIKFLCKTCKTSFCCSCFISHQQHEIVDIHDIETSFEVKNYIESLINSARTEQNKSL